MRSPEYMTLPLWRGIRPRTLYLEVHSPLPAHCSLFIIGDCHQYHNQSQRMMDNLGGLHFMGLMDYESATGHHQVTIESARVPRRAVS